MWLCHKRTSRGVALVVARWRSAVVIRGPKTSPRIARSGRPHCGCNGREHGRHGAGRSSQGRIVGYRYRYTARAPRWAETWASGLSPLAGICRPAMVCCRDAPARAAAGRTRPPGAGPPARDASAPASATRMPKLTQPFASVCAGSHLCRWHQQPGQPFSLASSSRAGPRGRRPWCPGFQQVQALHASSRERPRAPIRRLSSSAQTFRPPFANNGTQQCQSRAHGQRPR